MAQPTLATDRHDHPARPGPVRLTRRGRAVVGAIMVVCVTATSALLWLALGGPALASGGAGPGRQPGTGMLRVVVGPRQTLWSIATRADPAADPRVIIPQIVGDNRLDGTVIYTGEVLWVPRG